MLRFILHIMPCIWYCSHWVSRPTVDLRWALSKRFVAKILSFLLSAVRPSERERERNVYSVKHGCLCLKRLNKKKALKCYSWVRAMTHTKCIVQVTLFKPQRNNDRSFYQREKDRRWRQEEREQNQSKIFINLTSTVVFYSNYHCSKGIHQVISN